MRKAFKSSAAQDQQVLSKHSTPNSVADMYNGSDRPPPLSTLTAYRYTACAVMGDHRLQFQVGSHFYFLLNTERIPLMR